MVEAGEEGRSVVATAAVACPVCGAPDEGGATCRACGLLLRRRGPPEPVPPTGARAGEDPVGGLALSWSPSTSPAGRPEARAEARPAPPPAWGGVPARTEDRAWPYLAIGAVLAPVLTTTPLLRYVGWFLASLVHETGHCLAAWFVGCPAFPAIRLDGHAAAVHGPQSIPLFALVWAGLAAVAWRVRESRAALVSMVAVLALHPLLALTRGREGLFLVSGHLGELGFATVFLWRAWTGGFTASRVERGLYAVLGWFLVGRNAWLSAGLAWSDQAKATYASNGSFGLENDYVRLAREVVGGSTEAVAVGMLLVAVATPFVAWSIAAARRGDA
jgi:hypothetical protein